MSTSPASLHDLAGAAEAGFASCGDAHAGGAGGLEDRVAGLAGALLAGGVKKILVGSAPPSMGAAVATSARAAQPGESSPRDSCPCRSRQTFKAISRLPRMNGSGPAAEDGAVAEIGRQQR
jgi:hypothetical protein